MAAEIFGIDRMTRAERLQTKLIGSQKHLLTFLVNIKREKTVQSMAFPLAQPVSQKVSSIN